MSPNKFYFVGGGILIRDRGSRLHQGPKSQARATLNLSSFKLSPQAWMRFDQLSTQIALAPKSPADPSYSSFGEGGLRREISPTLLKTAVRGGDGNSPLRLLK